MYFTASTSAKSTSLREKLSMLSGKRQNILKVCMLKVCVCILNDKKRELKTEKS